MRYEMKAIRTLTTIVLFLMILISTSMLLSCFSSGDGTIGAGSISGEIIAPGNWTAPVYILAIPYEHRGKLRKIEIEVSPLRSPYVAAYTSTTGMGTYTITGLPDGDYILWAWMDKNLNGGVEHQNFAEPVGWYQSESNLAANKLTIANKGNLSGINIQLYQPTPFPVAETRVTVVTGGGLLKTIKGNKTLVLWGTGQERAKAMGLLLAPQIMDWINFVLIENYARSADYYENKFLPVIRKNLWGLTKYTSELQAVLDGMRESGTSLYSFRLKRDITVDDLKGVNSFYTLPMTMIYGSSAETSIPSCSSTVVWGDRTDNTELARGLIHGKNMDGENDLRKITVNDLLIVAVDPSEAGLQRAVAINWPGFIGMDMGMNESGLILAPHSAASAPDWNKTDMLDNDLIYRETLQTTSTPQAAWSYWQNPGTTRVGGFNTAISGPYLTAVDYPSLTLETDSNGGAARDPLFMVPQDGYSILTTNAFYKYGGHSSPAADDYRYWAMLNKLNDFASEDRTIGTPEMIEILRAASRTKQYDGVTEYSFIGYPDAMKFALAKEDLVGKILEASYATYVLYDFDEVFDR